MDLTSSCRRIDEGEDEDGIWEIKLSLLLLHGANNTQRPYGCDVMYVWYSPECCTTLLKNNVFQLYIRYVTS